MILAASLMGIASGPALGAGSSRPYSEGGAILGFLPILAQYNRSGELFRIEGTCKSACTMFLAIRNVCVDRSAVLMFHAGHDFQPGETGPNTRASHIMLDAYNTQLRAHLLAGHHMDTLAFYPLAGDELIDRFGYKECPGH